MATKTYYIAELVEQQMTEYQGTPAIVLQCNLIAKEEKGRQVPIEPKPQSIWIFYPDKARGDFSVEDQIEALEKSIFHWNPNWDGDYTELGFTKFKVSSTQKNDKTYWNLVGPGTQNRMEKADAQKAWSKLSRRARKHANASPATKPAAPVATPAPEAEAPKPQAEAPVEQPQETVPPFEPSDDLDPFAD